MNWISTIKEGLSAARIPEVFGRNVNQRKQRKKTGSPKQSGSDEKAMSPFRENE